MGTIQGEPNISFEDQDVAEQLAISVVADAQRKLGLSQYRAGRLLANILDLKYSLIQCDGRLPFERQKQMNEAKDTCTLHEQVEGLLHQAATIRTTLSRTVDSVHSLDESEGKAVVASIGNSMYHKLDDLQDQLTQISKLADVLERYVGQHQDAVIQAKVPRSSLG